MNNRTILLTFCAAVILTGCQEERKNPLLDKPTHEVVNWIFENTSADIEECAQSWADPKTALNSDLERCKSVASKIVDEMNYVSFAQNITVDDLNAPLIWRSFNDKVKNRSEFEKSIQEKQKKSEQNLKGLDLLK